MRNPEDLACHCDRGHDDGLQKHVRDPQGARDPRDPHDPRDAYGQSHEVVETICKVSYHVVIHVYYRSYSEKTEFRLTG